MALHRSRRRLLVALRHSRCGRRWISPREGVQSAPGPRQLCLSPRLNLGVLECLFSSPSHHPFKVAVQILPCSSLIVFLLLL